MLVFGGVADLSPKPTKKLEQNAWDVGDSESWIPAWDDPRYKGVIQVMKTYVEYVPVLKKHK